MGQYDIFVIGGIAVAAGYYLITNPSILQGIFPTTEPSPTEDPAGVEVEMEKSAKQMETPRETVDMTVQRHVVIAGASHTMKNVVVLDAPDVKVETE